MFNVKMNMNTIIKVYIQVYMLVMIVFCMSNKPQTLGEADDYLLTSISIINDQNISISKNDVELAKKYFPEWSYNIDRYHLSGRNTREGEEMPWYFGTYSFCAVPYILLLYFLKLPATFAFTFTNLTCVWLLLLLIWKKMNISDKRKLALIVLSTINPVIFYYVWPSAEVFIFSFIGMSLVFWYNKEYKKSAICISLAGTMNPTVMVVGLGILVDYFYNICKGARSAKEIVNKCKNQIKDLVLFGLCFVISLIPFAYNYYHIGHINIAASYKSFVIGDENNTILNRALAYLFDLNYGMLPYFPIIITLSIILLLCAFFKRSYRYIFVSLVSLGTIVGYSFMAHINCGMSGIARYNVWGSVLIVFAVCLYFDKIILNKILRKIIICALIASPIILATIIFNYGPMHASNISYTSFTPIAKFILNRASHLYNPLFCTFNSRVSHKDGGYFYQTPITFVNERGYAKKILASSKDKEFLKKNYYVVSQQDRKWFINKLDTLQEHESYISIPRKIKIREMYLLGEDNALYFNKDTENVAKYFKDKKVLIAGDNWTTTKKINLLFQLNNYKKGLYKGVITIGAIYNRKLKIRIYVNKNLIQENIIEKSGEVPFIFYAGKKAINLLIEFPNAISPFELKGDNDKRQLAFKIQNIKFVTEPISEYKLGEFISFERQQYNAAKYILNGFSRPEENATWTNGRVASMAFKIGKKNANIKVKMNVADVYNDKQLLRVFCNNKLNFENVIKGRDKIEFFCKTNEAGNIIMSLHLPNAVSPLQRHLSKDKRLLGIKIKNIVVEK